MASGGARARSGPAPTPGSGRSDQRGLVFEVLPVEGYKGEAPEFPLAALEIYGTDFDGERYIDTEQSADRNNREQELWEHVWTYPQAVAWAREPWRWYSVAEWVRLAVLCETADAKAADTTAKLRLAEQIGLTPAGLALNRWQVGEGAHSAPAEDKPRRRSSRDRVKLKVVPNDRDSA